MNINRHIETVEFTDHFGHSITLESLKVGSFRQSAPIDFSGYEIQTTAHGKIEYFRNGEQITEKEFKELFS
jgi:hypothetical protein